MQLKNKKKHKIATNEESGYKDHFSKRLRHNNFGSIQFNDESNIANNPIQ